ncbi:MAG: hypothetical protein JJE09_16120, partial [Bacteroidia bacterium]|nr:hypothetical protein [Bacteroidia bacterium]
MIFTATVVPTMHLRSNIVLKFFALFLFTLEFLAPAVITGLAPNEIATDKAVLVDASNLHNPFYSIFFDELCGNGEG